MSGSEGHGERLDSISSMPATVTFGSGTVDITVDVPATPNNPAPTNFSLYGGSDSNPQNGTALTTSAGRPANNRLVYSGSLAYTPNARFYVAVKFDQPGRITLKGGDVATETHNGGDASFNIA